MARLTAEERNELPSSEFAEPAERKYPIENRSHAANAKARAVQQWNNNEITEEQKRAIERKANRVLRGKAK